MASPPDVVLRRPIAGDVDARYQLGFSAEIIRMYGSDPAGLRQITKDDATTWYQQLVEHPCAWVIEADGRLAGSTRLDNINQEDQRARLAIGLLQEKDLGRGIGRAAIQLVLDHAFGTLELHRVDLRVIAYNRRAIRCYQACGFRHEGTEREAAFVAGEWHDDWIMGILSHEHRLNA